MLENENVLKILVATDSHLGYLEQGEHNIWPSRKNIRPPRWRELLDIIFGVWLGIYS